MSIRIFLTTILCIAFSCRPSLAQTTSALPPQIASTKNSEVGENRVEVYRCRYIPSADAQAILQRVFPDSSLGWVVADIRSNTLLVSGPVEMQKQSQVMLGKLDIPSSTPAGGAELLNLQTDFLKNHKGLISSFAESSGVTFALEEDLGLVMLKGKKDQVEETQRFIEVLKKMKVVAVAPQTSVAIRVLWLTNGLLTSEMATEADPKLQQIIDRLGKQGIKNLAIGMQLISRCDPTPGTPGKCKVSGNVDLTNTSLELLVDASFSQVQNTQVFSGHIDIRAMRTPKAPPGGVSLSSVQVDVNVEPGKYYVLSSTPVGNHHSIFVVQLLDEF